MFAYYHSFVNLLFIGVIALFPVVNPIGSAFIVNSYFDKLERPERKKVVKKVAFYAFCVCTVSLFAGQWILQMFGLSIPVIQLAGGIMICKTGWDLLTADNKPAIHEQADLASDGSQSYNVLQDKLFYPITFPITTGAGTISVLFTLSANSANDKPVNYLLNMGALILSIIVMCVLIYFFYLNTETLVKYLGSKGEKIINRIVAFLTFCVGLQIAVAGITTIVKG